MAEHRRSRVIAFPTLGQALKEELTFPDDLRFIMEATEIGVTGLANTLGVKPKIIYYWLNGGLPKYHSTFRAIKLWADQLRASKQKAC